MRPVARRGERCRSVATTRPYYRSTLRVRDARDSASITDLRLDDPRLSTLSIGVQMVGNDAINTPPAHAIASRGIIDNVHGYMLYGNYARPNPAADIVRAVERGEVDVALVWGPLAGYFAHRSSVPLEIYPVTPAGAAEPMAFDISMGVQAGNAALLEEVNEVLARQQSTIDRILRAFDVPHEASQPLHPL